MAATPADAPMTLAPELSSLAGAVELLVAVLLVTVTEVLLWLVPEGVEPPVVVVVVAVPLVYVGVSGVSTGPEVEVSVAEDSSVAALVLVLEESSVWVVSSPLVISKRPV